MEVVIKGLQLILALSILVVVHEFGHFLFARLFKTRVEKFYLFFDPWFSLFKYKPKNSDTEYGIGWVPLGGYVKIAGMIDESMDKEQMSQPAKPDEFRAKPAYARLLIMIGGVLFNFILAFLIYAGIAFTWGDAYLPLKNVKAGMEYAPIAKSIGFQDGDIILSVDGQEFPRMDVQKFAEADFVQVLRQGKEVSIDIPADFMNQLLAANAKWVAKERIPFVVAQVMDAGPASQAGVQVGDSLLSIAGVATPSVELAVAQIQNNKGKTLDFTFSRQGSAVTLPISVSDAGTIAVGMKSPLDMYEVVTQKYGLIESFPVGAQKAVDKFTSYVSSLKYVFTKEGAQSLGGFVSIGKIFPGQWNWYAFWEMTALLSIMLGFMNILPIPALDGGHVLFLLYEVVTRRKPNEKFMEYVQMAGMLLLLALLIFANGNDIYKLIFS